MQKVTRRRFLATSAGTAGVVVASALAAGCTTAPKGHLSERVTARTLRSLGNSGLKCSVLGMGTGVKAWNGDSELKRKGHDVYMQVLVHAYESGLRHFDLADMYGAHPFMREALKGPIDRNKVTLITKTAKHDADGVRADLERFRKELDVDQLDLVLMHCVTDPDWPEKCKPLMDVMADAKAKGIIRAHGLSCHHLGALARVADTSWADVVLARINPFGIKMDGKPEEVVPLLRAAHEKGKGVLGMKIAGEGACSDRIGESIHYVLNLGCVDGMTIGFLSIDDVSSAIAHIRAVEST